MTVDQLIRELQNYPGDLEIILQRDPEGNGYSPLAGSDTAIYISDDECWSDPEIYEEYYEKEYESNAVVLWPLY